LLLANLTNLKYVLLMALRPEDLPSDPARLIEMVLSLDAENDRLRAVIGTFKDMVFGSRSEKLCAVGSDPPGVAYTYAPGRGGEHAVALLTGYSGIVQCDGYAVYKQLADPGRDGGAVTLAYCWLHWRRYFFDIDKGGAAPIAHEALERIAALYAIENRIRGRSAEERRAVRQAQTKPLVEALRAWLENRLMAVSDKSTIAEAIRYGFNHWDGLVRFLDDGRIEMDTNSVERAMRPIALNRKNSLFAGHDQGAVNWACLASLIETAKLHGIDPQGLSGRHPRQARQWLARTETR